MATLYVEEFSAIGEASNLTGPALSTAQAGKFPSLTGQTVSIGGGSVQSSAFNAATTLIRVHTDVICSVLIGSNPTALTTRNRMAANQTEYFGVRPGDKIAVISNS
jgi:hypothetical protein